MWLQIAAEGGEEVSEALRLTGVEISEHEIDQARQRAVAWLAQHHREPAASTLISSHASVVATP